MMGRGSWLVALLMTTQALGAARAAAPVHAVTGIAPLALHDGINRLPGLLPDHGTLTIIQSWRENNNAHGYHDWLVLAPDQAGAPSLVITHPDPRDGVLADLVSDAPFDGERVLDSVAFARGQVDGSPATLLLDAALDDPPSGIPADHATATLRVWRLEATADAPGETKFEFRPVLVRRSGARFCNAELALSRMLALPLPASYEGANRTDGCFSGPGK